MARNKIAIYKDSMTKISEHVGEDVFNDKDEFEKICNELVKEGAKIYSIDKETKLLLELLLINAQKLNKTEQIQKNLNKFLKEQNLGIFDLDKKSNEE